MKPMLPTLTFSVPSDNGWIFEPKYDGFRALLFIKQNSIVLISRNGHDISLSFPEITQFVQKLTSSLKQFLPLILDGELVYLASRYRANFEIVQQRGRLKSPEKIQDYSANFTCHYVVFDLLTIKGIDKTKTPLLERKEALQTVFQQGGLPLHADPYREELIQLVETSRSYQPLWEKIVQHEGEGIVAKQIDSYWEEGKRTKQWLKVKNYREALFFLLGFNITNGYFHVGVHEKGKIIPVGSFTHGLKEEERKALLHIIKENGVHKGSFIELEPAICVKLKFLSFLQGQLREPFFHSFALEHSWKECTLFQLKLKNHFIHHDVRFTHLDKLLWPKTNVKKENYLAYLLDISSLMLPFLQDRALTVVRYPHGMLGEAFFQKNCPDYAPSFIQKLKIDDIKYIVCQNISTLMWLGNQLAIEFHIPFHTVKSHRPKEIVFDLDPPGKQYFHLAVKAAIELQKCFIRLNIRAFPKLSGNKGIQLHIPLSSELLTFEETRQFTSFFANYLTKRFPDFFTTERLKKKRGLRLYIDYIQHAEGKTIIAPYSVRGNERGTVAAPLFWDEVNEELQVDTYTMNRVLQRLKKRGCPMKTYFQVKNEAIKTVIEQLNDLS